MDMERPDKNATYARTLWYPEAEVITPHMKTRGVYRKGWPEGAIVHFTAGRDDGRNTINWGREQGYAYLCIQGDGKIFQAHPMNEAGSHAGKSEHPKLGSGVSQYLVGIEVTSAGRLEHVGANKFKSWFGSTYTADQVRYSKDFNNIHEGWYHRFTNVQEEALIRLIKWLYYQNPLVFDIDLVLGHDEVSPGRKNDPGAALSMSMKEFRQTLKDDLRNDFNEASRVPLLETT